MKNFLPVFLLITLVVMCKAGDDDDDCGCEEKKCPKGEKYEECGPCNQPNCDDKHPDNDGKHCKGCFCHKGYIRKYKGGPCIEEEDCPKCPKGEIYETCGPAIQADCDNRYPDSDKNCTVGCFCPKGQVRINQGGPCIPIKDCPPSPCKGDPYAVWVKDPNICPPTCQHRKQPKKCHGDCDHYGCECKKGYILDEVSHKCVDPDDCPCGCDDDDH